MYSTLILNSTFTPDVVDAQYLDGYRVRVTFADGLTGVVDLSAELWGEVFEPLLDLELFKSLRVDAELGTVVWPNGADLAPEFLYKNAL